MRTGMQFNQDASALKDLDSCRSLLKALDEKLRSLHQWKALEQQLEPLQQARMHLAIANSASTAFQILLSLQGLSTDAHAHAKELARLEAYKRKVSKTESKKWLKEHKPSLSINVAGTNRFISAAIPELSKEQKQALRMAKGKSSQAGPVIEANSDSTGAATRFLEALAAPPILQGEAAEREAPVESEGERTAGYSVHPEVDAPLSKKQKRKLSREMQRQKTGKKKGRVSWGVT